MRKRVNGFTIVELLIVIVVIAILVAISVVAYTGVQQRSRNAQVISGVNIYYKALLQYATLNSNYPTMNSCLGDGYPSDQCWNGPSGNASVDSMFDVQMATVMSSKPILATELFPIGVSTNQRAGAVWRSSERRIIYYLQGPGQNCNIANSTGSTEGGVVTQCSLVLPQS